MKKLFLLVVTACLAFAVSGTAQATAKLEQPEESKVTKKSAEFKDTDTVVELSSGVQVHGQIEIYEMSNPNQPILSLDTDKDTRAKKYGDIKRGAKPNIVQVPKSGLEPFVRVIVSNVPPTQLMNLRKGAWASESWGGGYYWHFASYAYQPVPVVNEKRTLHFNSSGDSMLAGDSWDWNNTYRTGIGYGETIPESEGVWYPVTSHAPGNILSCWSYNPATNRMADYTVTNPGY